MYDNIDETTSAFHLHVEEGTNRPERLIQIPGFTFEGYDWNPHVLFIQHILGQIPEDLQDIMSLNPPNVHSQGELTKKHGYDVEISDELKELLGIRKGDQSLQIQRINMIVGLHTLSHAGEGLWIKIISPPTPTITRHRLTIPHGLYTKTQDLLQAMSDTIPTEHTKSVIFDENRDGTISIYCKPHIKVKFPSNNHGLGSLLGFEDRKSTLPREVKGEYPVDLKRGVYGLYVYSNLVQPHVVGDTFAPLLRVIPIQEDNRYSSSYVKIYTNPDFYPIVENRFETIEMDIRTDFGKRLHFRNGKTMVKLLFKKV